MLLSSSVKIVVIAGSIAVLVLLLREAHAASMWEELSTGGSEPKDQMIGANDALKYSQEQEANLQQQQKQQTSSMLNAAASAAQQAQQAIFDPANIPKFIEFGLNPVGSSMKYLLPNTYQGVQSDLTNGYSTLSNGVQNGYLGQLGSSMVPQAMNMLDLQNSYRNRYTQMLQQRLMQSEEMLRQMYELTSNPEQMCRQFMQTTKDGIEKSNQLMAEQQHSLGNSASTFMNKLANGFAFG